jgi:hypothetical protein
MFSTNREGIDSNCSAMVVVVAVGEVVEVATAVEEAGTTEDRANGEVEEGAELEEVGGEEDGVVVEEEEEIPDNHQITKTSDTRMTSIPRAIGILATVTTGHQEAGEVSSVIIRDLLITTKIRIKEVGDMDQLVLAMIVTTSIKHLRLLNSVIQGILRKLLGGYTVHIL